MLVIAARIPRQRETPRTRPPVTPDDARAFEPGLRQRRSAVQQCIDSPRRRRSPRSRRPFGVIVAVDPYVLAGDLIQT
ncbi:hypothetical protein CBM2599_B20130 [Cupriavidus taiwanensis]|nr:hypothetical protein CBM2599_B20130 [Cupriavidus taiwanensis]SOY98593.1 hypothetical protein CBM2600_B30127 [Cupriavidus taiwanensis]